jgi:membrane protease YdiL (CAAX protease family)
MAGLRETIGYDKSDRQAYFILFSSPLLLSIYWYFGYKTSFLEYVPDWQANPVGDYYASIMQFAAFFLLVGIIPAIYLKFFMKKSLSEIGLGLGDWKLGLKLVAGLIPLIAIILYFGTDSPDVRGEYPLSKALHTHRDLIWSYQLAYVLFYYVAWEFYFRGFMLFGLKDRFGGFNAILIQTIASCLIHLGKPAGETIGAIFVGVIFGAIALRTRSIWWVFLLHISDGNLH